MRKTRTVLLCSLLSLLAVCICCRNQTTKPTGQYLNLHDSVAYVGIETCKSCHYDQYKTFTQTGMGQSFDKVSKKKSALQLSGTPAIYDLHKDFHYQPYWKGEVLSLREFRLWQGDTTHLRNEQVDYIIGSGQHTNSHICNVKGYLHQMPFTYYTQEGTLDFPPGYEDGNNSRFDRKIGLECMTCHNALPDFVMGSENKFTKVPKGISCERCHGPGQVHVERMLAGAHTDTSKHIDYSIVNPAKLTVEKQFQICQRCHLQGNAVLKAGKSFFDFKPGMQLSEVMAVFVPRYEGAEDDFIMASHVDRFKMSACFTNYPERFTCISCHNPHVSVKHTDKKVFNKTCEGCHSETKHKLCALNPDERENKANNCVSCHMPRSGATDIPHVSVTDHYIRIPQNKKKTAALKKFVSLYCVNEAKPGYLTKAKAYLQQYERFGEKPVMLDSAYYMLTKADPAKAQLNDWVHYYFLRKDYSSLASYVSQVGQEQVLSEVLTKASYSNEDAWTAYRIGEAYSASGQTDSAFIFYRHAVELAPYQLEFQNKLGVAYVRKQDMKAAKKVFEFILDEYPKEVRALSNLGFVYLNLGQLDKADSLYNRALALDPDYEQGLLNKAGLLVFREKKAAAKKVLLHLLERKPNHLQARYMLGQLK